MESAAALVTTQREDRQTDGDMQKKTEFGTIFNTRIYIVICYRMVGRRGVEGEREKERD